MQPSGLQSESEIGGAEPIKNRWWPLTGAGIERLGVGGRWIETVSRTIGNREILTSVEALTICASDAKITSLGNAYPLLEGRDLDAEPVCLGHELALRVIDVGDSVSVPLFPSQRIGLQTGVFVNGVRHCVGVDLPGGMADQVVLGPDVLDSDHGSMAYPIDSSVSRAATALLEPLACVEAAFSTYARSGFRAGGRLVVLCAAPELPWTMDLRMSSARTDLLGIDVSKWTAAGGSTDGCSRYSLNQLIEDESPIDDLLVLGPANPMLVGKAYDRLSFEGSFTWLSPVPPDPDVEIDFAHFHYNRLTHCGAPSTRLSNTWSHPPRSEYRPGGRLLVVGASGPMGRMHLMRAISADNGPQAIFAVGRDPDKLNKSILEFSSLAKEHRVEVHPIATGLSSSLADELRNCPGSPFDDIVVVAPGREAFVPPLKHLANGGLLVGFAGTASGTRVPLPLGRLVDSQISLTAKSGSSVGNQQEVLKKIEAGRIVPERLIAAVGGFPAIREAVKAVLDRRYSGKILILPAVNWPLTELRDLFRAIPDLASLSRETGVWSKAIEDAVLDGKFQM